MPDPVASLGTGTLDLLVLSAEKGTYRRVVTAMSAVLGSSS